MPTGKNKIIGIILSVILIVFAVGAFLSTDKETPEVTLNQRRLKKLLQHLRFQPTQLLVPQLKDVSSRHTPTELVARLCFLLGECTAVTNGTAHSWPMNLSTHLKLVHSSYLHICDL